MTFSCVLGLVEDEPSMINKLNRSSGKIKPLARGMSVVSATSQEKEEVR